MSINISIKPKLAALTIALTVSLASSASWANLIVNGDFEAPVISGPGATSGYEYRTTLPGWTVSSPGHNGVVLFNSSYVPGNLQAVDAGAQSLQIEYPGDSIEQSISTIAGQSYFLSFDLNAYTPPGISSLQVEIDNVALAPFMGTSANWATYTVFFAATSASTLIHFESLGSLGTYPHLDNVVAEVPEPASIALFGLGVAALGLRRRKHA